MQVESRNTVHLGANYVMTPAPVLTNSTQMGFIRILGEFGVEFSGIQRQDGMLTITVGNANPPSLQIIVGANQQGPIGQLVVLAPNGSMDATMFAEQLEAITGAFSTNWPEHFQIAQLDITIRDLYDTSGPHAFVELWEQRLNQSHETLEVFGRQILGGGLRFVFPPLDEQPLTELKIESFLSDTSKLFVEAQFIWKQNVPQITLGDSKIRVTQVNEFIQNKVTKFIQGG